MRNARFLCMEKRNVVECSTAKRKTTMVAYMVEIRVEDNHLMRLRCIKLDNQRSVMTRRFKRALGGFPKSETDETKKQIDDF